MQAFHQRDQSAGSTTFAASLGQVKAECLAQGHFNGHRHIGCSEDQTCDCLVMGVSPATQTPHSLQNPHYWHHHYTSLSKSRGNPDSHPSQQWHDCLDLFVSVEGWIVIKQPPAGRGPDVCSLNPQASVFVLRLEGITVIRLMTRSKQRLTEGLKGSAQQNNNTNLSAHTPSTKNTHLCYGQVQHLWGDLVQLKRTS